MSCTLYVCIREIREIRIRPRLRHCKCCPCDALRQPRSPVWLNVLVSPGSAYKYYLRRGPLTASHFGANMNPLTTLLSSLLIGPLCGTRAALYRRKRRGERCEAAAARQGSVTSVSASPDASTRRPGRNEGASPFTITLTNSVSAAGTAAGLVWGPAFPISARELLSP